ncbi:hypothetical protein REPUB_Repub05bG0037200 [Reevesia pubescens]
MPNREFYIFVWISAAIAHNVRKLDLSLPLKGDYLLPYVLFTSRSLSKFRLELYCRLRLPSSICFVSLKTLHLIHVKFYGDKSTKELFSSCPVLKELVLENCGWTDIKDITLYVPSLREFTICNDAGNFHDLLDCKIKICAVNLISFHCTSYMIVELLPYNLSSLVYAYIDITFTTFTSPQEERSRCAAQLLSGIQKVKYLSLTDATLGSLDLADFLRVHLPTLDKLTSLKVECESAGSGVYSCDRLINFLQKAPNLESLEIDDGINLEGVWVLEILPHCVKSCLKTFSISDFNWNAAEIHLLKYMFNNATVLERVRIFCSENPSEDVKKQEIFIHECNMLRRGLTNCVIEFF